MMNKEQFTTELVNHLKVALGNDYFVRIEHATKNNGVKLLGVTVGKQNQTACPIIYMESFYSQFLNGRNLESIADEVISIYEKNDIMADFDLTDALSNSKDKIFFRLVNTEANQFLISNVPHKTWNDLSVIYYVDFGTDGDNCHQTLVITDMMCDFLGFSVEDLDKLARANAERVLQASISGMSSILAVFGYGDKQPSNEELADNETLYVLTNTKKFLGASTVLYSNLISDFAKKMNFENIFIIPSSIHEVLLLPDRGNMSIQDLNKMVCDINNSLLDPEEVLSSNCYIYTRQTDSISVA